MPFEGIIDMKNPEITYSILNNDTEWYFCILLAESNRNLMDIFDVKKRSYIGITSMNAELSLVMSNMAKLRPGKLVYDPFVSCIW